MKNDAVFTDRRLLQAIDLIDPKFIAEVFDDLKVPENSVAEYTKPSPFKHWKQYLTAAACILLLSLMIPVCGYVSEVIGSLAASTGANTSDLTESFESVEETLNGIESTEEQNVTEPTPNFPYSNVKIIADNNTSINPVSVHIGYTWYKDEKSAFTEEIAGWQYVMSIESYKYENFPHLTLERRLTSSLPENVTISSFMVYSTYWEKSEYFFDNLYELSNLPAGDYIIVGIEKEKIPYDKPHYVIGEYDYKLDRSAIIFGLTVTEKVEQNSTLSYLMFTPELEDVDESVMLDVKKAWKEYWYNDWYSIYYFISSYPDQDAARLAAEQAQQKAEEAYMQLFNSEYFDSYGYLGTFGDIIVISAYRSIDNSELSMDVPYTYTEYYVYYNGKIYTHTDALLTSIIFEDQIKNFNDRNTKYLECMNN